MLYPHLLMASVVGMSAKEISDTLGLNYRTVQQRMAAMGVKTHVFFVPAKDRTALVMEIDKCMREWFREEADATAIGPLMAKEASSIERLLHAILAKLKDLESDPQELNITQAAEDAIRGILEHGSLSAAAKGDPARKASMSTSLRRAGIVSVRAALPDECAQKIRAKAEARLREVLDAGD